MIYYVYFKVFLVKYYFILRLIIWWRKWNNLYYKNDSRIKVIKSPCRTNYFFYDKRFINIAMSAVLFKMETVNAIGWHLRLYFYRTIEMHKKVMCAAILTVNKWLTAILLYYSYNKPGDWIEFFRSNNSIRT